MKIDLPARAAGRWLAAAMTAVSLLLAACGGGDAVPDAVSPTAAPGDRQSIQGVGSGGTGRYSRAMVRAVGPLVLGDAVYDTSSAVVVDADGVVRDIGAVGVGMVAEVLSDGTAPGTPGNPDPARSLHVVSELLGPVAEVDAPLGQFSVLSQRVRADARTVFGPGLLDGLAGLAPGDVIEVAGFFDVVDGAYRATRIDLRPDATELRRIRGTVQQLDPLRRTFRMGALRLSYRGLPEAEVPAALADGLVVRARLAAAPVGGVWTVQRLQPGADVPGDEREAEVEGLVDAVLSPTRFSVGGVTVDAGGAVVRPRSRIVEPGSRVEVHGVLSGGVLVARTVGVEESSWRELEMKGRIDGIDWLAKTFTLRGKVIEFGSRRVAWVNGPRGSIRVGMVVEVHALRHAATGRIVATEIAIER